VTKSGVRASTAFSDLLDNAWYTEQEEREMSLRTWHGRRVFFTLDSDGLIADDSVSFEEPMDQINIADGDTIVRILFGWQAETQLISNTLAASKAMRPLKVGVTYNPSPEGELIWSAQSDGGDALAKEYATWHEHSWTDGTLHSTSWYSGSEGMRSYQGQRQIQDKTVASLNIQASIRCDLGTPPNGISSRWVDSVIVNGSAWLEYLLQRA